MIGQAVLNGPKGHFLSGNMQEFNQDTLQFLLDQRQYGALSRFYFGPFPLILVNHPDYLHDVLVTNADKYYKGAASKQILDPILGKGLFTNDGESWKRQRRLVQPAFHTKRIAAYAQTMVDYADDLAKAWHGDQVRAIDKDMTALTMRIIAKTLFDADVTTEASEVGDTIRDALALVEDRFKTLVMPPSWLPTAHNRKMRAAVARLDTLIGKFIQDRHLSGEDKGDFLSLLLAARDEDNSAMTDKQVRDEAMTLFGAGHETTAGTLTWVWYLLSQHPDVEAKLHEELARVLGGRTPTLEDLAQLPYTEMVVKETMRLYPAAFVVTRQVHEPVELGGHPLKKGQVVICNFYGVHHDAQFFPEPERFIPERFSPENEKTIAKYAYIPFGGGPRVCIGNAFSMMESRLVLAALAQHFSLSLAPDFVVKPERQFTLRSKYGMQMVIHERQQVRSLEIA